MASAVIFYDDVTFWATRLMLLALLVIEVAALVNCLTQRADAFPVVGPLSKIAWIGILLASILFTLVCGIGAAGMSIFSFAAITAAAIYLLDVRPALRDATSGSGGW